MKKLVTSIVFLCCFSLFSFAQLNVAKLVEPDHVKVWNFDTKTQMSFAYYSKKGKLKSTIAYETFSSNDYNLYGVSYKQGQGTYFTLFDTTNNVVVQYWLTNNEVVMANITKLKKTKYKGLTAYKLHKTEETKEINGYKCVKYTFDDKRVYGDMWVTDEVDFNPDAGLIRASKMRMFGQIEVDGFVMQLSSVNKRWKNKTVMTVDKILMNEKSKVDITGVELGVSINKANWCDL